MQVENVVSKTEREGNEFLPITKGIAFLIYGKVASLLLYI